MASIGSFSGLASGIQWRDMIDQIMAAESARQLDPVKKRSSDEQIRRAAFNDYRSVVAKLADAARRLRDGSAFGALAASAGTSPTTSRALFSASASATAAPGAYKVEVLGLAQAEKVGGSAYADATTALNLADTFWIDGRAIQLVAADSLSAIRDKINAANTGPTPIGVTATIMSTGPTSNRLVLTNDATGAAGIELVDGDNGALKSLGLLTGSTTTNVTASGGSRTNRFTSSTTAIATILGITFPPPSTIKVGGKTITVDLNTDSLASIAQKINAAGISASVVTETVGATTYSRISVAAAPTPDVTPITDPSGVNATRALEVLGFTRDTQSAVAQSLRTELALTDNATGLAATGGALVTNLRSLGSPNALAVGETVNIRGTRGDGTAVDIAFAVTGTSTLNDLVAAINDPAKGFGSPSRSAVASVDASGKIVLADQTAGDSQLSLALTTSRAGALDFGRALTETKGYARKITAGTDASLRIDGAVVTRSTNTITDALAGVTLNLLQAETGTTVDLSLTRDTDAAVNAVQAFAMAYNAVQSFVQVHTGVNGKLARDPSVRGSMGSFTSTMLTDVGGVTGSPYIRSAMVGLALTKTGTLEVDAEKLRGALATNLADVRKLFSEGGTATDSRVAFVASSSKTTPGAYAVEVTTLATAATRLGSVLTGGYVDDATPDRMTITDAVNGNVSTVDLVNGDTVDDIVAKLSSSFQTNKLRLAATNVGGALQIASTEVGSAASFTVAYDATASSTAQLGIAAGTYAGTDIQGTIGGQVATGAGRTLTGAVGTAMEGLAVSYSGAATGAMGTITHVLGVGGMMLRAADAVTRSGDGMMDTQIGLIDSRTAALDKRAEEIQHRLDLRREALTKQFSAMEVAMGRIQAQQSWLTGQIKALQPQS